MCTACKSETHKLRIARSNPTDSNLFAAMIFYITHECQSNGVREKTCGSDVIVPVTGGSGTFEFFVISKFAGSVMSDKPRGELHTLL